MPTLTEKYGKHFSEAIKKSGEQAASSAIRLWGGDEQIKCEFPSDGNITASLQIVGKRLVPTCSCADFKANRPCKHLWAAIVLAERFADLNCALKRSIPSKLQFAMEEATEAVYEKEKSRPQRIEGHEDEEGRIIVPEQVERRKRPAPTTTSVNTAESASQEIIYVIRPDKQKDIGHLTIDTWWRQPGTTMQAKPFVIDDNTTAPTPTDAELLSFLANHQTIPQNRHIVPAGALQFLDTLTTAQQLRWADTLDGKIKMRPLTIPLTMTADIEINVDFTDDARFRVTPRLSLPSEIIPFSHLQMIAQGVSDYGFALSNGRLLRVTFHGAAAALRQFVGNDSRILDYSEAIAFSRQLSLESTIDTSHFPDAISMIAMDGVPVGELYVRTAKYKYKDMEQLHAELSFNYDGISCPDDNAAKAATARTVITRNPEMEEKLRERLRELGFRYNTKAYLEELGWKLLPAELDNVVHTLINEGWNITAEGKTYRRPTTKQASVKSGLDWFEIQSGVSFDGQEVPLPTLLAAYKSGNKSVRLDDGTIGLLPIEWLANFTALTEIGEINNDRVRFRISQATLVSAILGERLEEGNAKLGEHIREIEKLSQPMPSAPSPNFHATLRDYQSIGLGWLENMQRAGLGACLADDMGLGKTIQVLALLSKRPKSAPPSLIVMPKSLIFNWLGEIQKFAPDMRTIVHTGAARDCSPKVLSDANIVLTTYGTLRNDATQLASFLFDYCILDESQAIKNYDSSTAKAVRCIKANHRITMTGTPIENNLGELFSQLDFLNPGLFGRHLFAAAPSPNNNREDSLVNRIRKGVRPFILRRTKQEVAKELPPKTEQTLWCEMSEDEQQEYDELLKYYQKQILEETGSDMQTLAALMRLRQAACHPGLIKSARCHDTSSKLETLLTTLEGIIPAGHKALVFSQFTSFLKIIEERLINVGYGISYLDGTTKNRADVVKEFQESPEKQIFLISLKAGGVGLNLTSADYVFIMDPWWNPATEAQAIDRAYRIGQTNPVMAYKIATKNTIEEKVLTLQAAKRSLANAIINDTSEIPSSFTMNDIRALLR